MPLTPIGEHRSAGQTLKPDVPTHPVPELVVLQHSGDGVHGEAISQENHVLGVFELPFAAQDLGKSPGRPGLTDRSS